MIILLSLAPAEVALSAHGEGGLGGGESSLGGSSGDTPPPPSLPQRQVRRGRQWETTLSRGCSIPVLGEVMWSCREASGRADRLAVRSS